MKSVLLTLDYELYGNGSGDVFEHVIEPTDRLLRIADEYGVKYTIFFEVVEYLKLKEEWDKGNSMGYASDPIKAIEDQIVDAFRRGHDVQLHIHPQWINAQFVDGRWTVDLSQWRLGGYVGSGEHSLENILLRGKQTIERLLRPVDPDYECVALRAGGYNIQPSTEIVEAMKRVGLSIDSSIYPGGRESGELSRYDYTAIPTDIGWWQTGEELERTGTEPIYELPIVALSIPCWRKYCSIDRIKSILRNRKSARETFQAKVSNGGGEIRYFLGHESQTWDYCLFSASLHRSFLQRVHSMNRDVFVLVGHPKNFVGEKGLRYLLSRVGREYSFLTISQTYDSLRARRKY